MVRQERESLAFARLSLDDWFTYHEQMLARTINVGELRRKPEYMLIWQIRYDSIRRVLAPPEDRE